MVLGPINKGMLSELISVGLVSSIIHNGIIIIRCVIIYIKIHSILVHYLKLNSILYYIGGKTVSLKALGLAAIMSKAGLYIPVD